MCEVLRQEYSIKISYCLEKNYSRNRLLCMIIRHVKDASSFAELNEECLTYFLAASISLTPPSLSLSLDAVESESLEVSSVFSYWHKRSRRKLTQTAMCIKPNYNCDTAILQLCIWKKDNLPSRSWLTI